jgi:glycosyltransferase involved in cell wall biosynthesis
VRVLALERPLPSLHALRSAVPGGRGADLRPLREWLSAVRAQPRGAALDGLDVRYVRFVSPPRPLSYPSWGRWAAPALSRALDATRRSARIDVVHAHYAVPSGDAVLRWIRRRGRLPLVVSVHGGDLDYTARLGRRGREAVTRTLRAADSVLANSELTRAGVEELVGPLPGLRVVHLGADLVAPSSQPHREPTLVTVAHLVPHKNQGSVIRALATLAGRHPSLRYVLVGKGPDEHALRDLARSLGVADRVIFRGALSHEAALEELARCHLHVMPSSHEPFGVAHIEAMAAGVPAVGGAGTGAEDIARAGEGIVLVPPGDLSAITRTIDELLSDAGRRARLAEAARQTVADHFSWKRNGAATAAVYRKLAHDAASGLETVR